MGKPHYCTYARRSEAAISRSPQEVERSRKKSQGVERSRKESQATARSRTQPQAAASSRKQSQAAASSRKQSQEAASSCSRSHGGGQGRCQGRCQRRPQSESCLSTAALLPPASTGRQRWRTRQRACAAWVSLEKWSSQNERSANKKEWSHRSGPPPTHTTPRVLVYVKTRLVPAYGPRRPCRCDIGAIIGADIGRRTVPLVRNSRYRYYSTATPLSRSPQF